MSVIKNVEELKEKLMKDGELTPSVCPHCATSLLCYDVKIDGELSMKLLARPLETKKNGRLLRLSIIWSDFHNTVDGVSEGSEQAIKEGEVVTIHCPYCYQNLTIEKKCECGAPMFETFEANEQEIIGIIHICSKSGCHSHNCYEIPKNFEPEYKYASFVTKDELKRFHRYESK